MSDCPYRLKNRPKKHICAFSVKYKTNVSEINYLFAGNSHVIYILQFYNTTVFFNVFHNQNLHYVIITPCLIRVHSQTGDGQEGI